ncbi:MAG TPA: radical SAM family heme chaperone HemW [Candidatus Tectomicrobia bacterium]|nr:radical SAM family heme chaperone HemW [Candidatus Tectomicrobia bacterium]
MPAPLQSPVLDGDHPSHARAGLSVGRRSATQALTIYVHIPFCIQKCGYCDFNAYLYRDDMSHAYLAALRQEIAHTAAERPWTGYGVSSVYFGGGTPSTLAPGDLTRLLGVVGDRFPVQPDAEITVEVDPGTIDLAGLEALRAGGFNRISIGVQAFDDALLTQLDRLHCAADARRVLAWARRSGFMDLNLDLMFGLPGQSLAAWEASVHEAMAFTPAHVSVYGLTIEERTPFYRRQQHGQLALPDEEEQVAMFERAHQLLTAAGYVHYEISNYALPGWRSRHNLHYWQHGEYLGFGAGAHAYVDGYRRENERQPWRYIQAIAATGSAAGVPELIDAERRVHEGLMVGLRLREGIDLKAFAHDYGVLLEMAYATPIAELTQAGYLEVSEGHLRLSDRGRLVADAVLSRLVAAEDTAAAELT